MTSLTEQIVALRPPRSPVDSTRPYAELVEQERGADGRIVNVATLFLTNRECLFRCAMCDLWKHTLVDRIPAGHIPRQIASALARLPPAEQIKLYNSGNFFDAQAIPRDDWPAIAQLVQYCSLTIVENHPRLCDDRVAEFQRLLAGELEVALGLETVHPQALAGLNKRMTVDDFDRAVDRLLNTTVHVRAFVLLNAPGIPAAESVEWTLRSIEHAVRRGARVASIIPLRPGNGYIDSLVARGETTLPTLDAMEACFERALNEANSSHRVFLDVWDLHRFATCHACLPDRRARLERMNLSQRIEPAVECHRCGGGAQS